MAIQPFVAMNWGAPKLSSGLHLQPRDSRTILTYYIWNVPITKGFLNKLRIRRSTAEDLSATFRIIEEPSGELVFSAMPLINTSNGVSARSVSLPASTTQSYFYIAIACDGKVYPERVGSEPLQVGSYRVEVDLTLEGKEKSHVRERFIVRDREPFIHFVQ